MAGLLRDFRVMNRCSADYHQQYLAKHTNGYCAVPDCSGFGDGVGFLECPSQMTGVHSTADIAR
jgi:hypothetical protein